MKQHHNQQQHKTNIKLKTSFQLQQVTQCANAHIANFSKKQSHNHQVEQINGTTTRSTPYPTIHANANANINANVNPPITAQTLAHHHPTRYNKSIEPSSVIINTMSSPLDFMIIGHAEETTKNTAFSLGDHSHQYLSEMTQ